MKEYKTLSEFYDLIHYDLDYEKNANEIDELIRLHKKSKGKKLLDVACGTGEHLKYLENKYKCTGLDINEEMIKIAKEKTNKTEYIVDDVRRINVDKRFDVITCMFNSLNHLEDIKLPISKFYNRLNQGGIVILEMHHDIEKIKKQKKQVREYKGKNISVRRKADVEVEGKYVNFKFQYTIFKTFQPGTVEQDKERITIHTQEEILQIMKENKFMPYYTLGGMCGNGLFLGIKH